ncbi:hypothetical protein PQ712_06675 [Staphylococcus ureilyticus]|uniref:hypothetical protein n=1 Tax=Staphylococcus ureilyticus TaxID=94138 RepID=UPI00292879C8|nr:hypothetical protein [Staphylococcus ureilyticus]MDU9371561.1 hypothetical protein [Staphylococcus ureilyticus]
MIAKIEEHFVVEVNDGVYLQERLQGYEFVKDIKKASLYENRYEAWQTAKECGGKVKRYVVTHEVMEDE